MDFKTNITIDASSKKQLLIRNADTHEVVLRYEPNELKVSDNGQKLEFQLKRGLTKGNYYVSIPEYLIFLSGLTFQGIYTKNDWQFKYEGDEQGNYADKVFVKGGTFDMGSNNGDSDEKPIHSVTVRDFYIGKYEVTNAQYAEFLNAKGNQIDSGNTWLDINSSYCQIEKVGNKFQAKSGKETYPVIEVTWYGARAYAQWVGGRLPTEAEWEYAARGGNQSQGYKYSGSNNIDDVAWYSSNTSGSNPRTQVVGTKQPNELDIYDMSGNVWEWCEDTWHGNYNGAPTDGSAWVDSNYTSRVVRGGSWNYFASYCRVAYRLSNNPNNSSDNYGFRVVFLP
ncbi:MAG: hypothetical protein CSA94_01405 [Bacteroidetes bacterium]|nr:MAG: hypothetical protein CSA94_01405 [Bacteroidota bacterium]